MKRHRLLSLVLVALALFAMAACGDDDGASSPPSKGSGAASAIRGDLEVFAAASLTEAFTELGDTFHDRYPKVDVTFNFAASSALAQQLDEGASADVFASADETNMAKVVDAGHAASPRLFARNRLAILVEKGNPKGIHGLADLSDPGVILVMCAPEVPCGKYGAAALAEAGVTARPASLEENVKAVVSKVTLGEADAGIVYATDVKAAGDDVTGVSIDIASEPELEAVYPMVALTGAPNHDAAEAWINFVLSSEGQQALSRFGFLGP